LQKVAHLGLPAGEFAVFGSGPLLVRKVIDQVNDIDILCRGAAWSYAQARGHKEHLDEYDIDIVSIDNGLITLGQSWGYGNFNVDELIDSADVIDGLPFVRLEYVVAYKRIANRPKDHAHLQALRTSGFWPAPGRAAK
jgi:hypothetical protein